jgi:hypothetical protein
LRIDTREEIVLRQKSIIGRVIEIEGVSEMRIIAGDPRQHSVATLTVLGGNQAVRVILPNE